MHIVVAQMTALDPEAGAAVGVIARFDELIERRAGLESIISAVALLTGFPARFVDRRYGITLRADLDGLVEHCVSPTDPQWVTAPLDAGDQAVIWMEHTGELSLVEAMVLDRAAFAARKVLERTRSGSDIEDVEDSAAMEVLLDAGASTPDRRHAARLLRLPADTTFRAVARSGAPAQVLSAPTALPGRWEGRTGIGPAVPVLDLPQSWEQARTALRFAAEDTDDDPGPSVVLAEELGALVLLADALGSATPPADVLALEAAAKRGPGVLRTLVEFTSYGSVRLAAEALYIHRSTLQDRLAVIERDLGWPVRDPQGRLRVQVALIARRLLRHPAEHLLR